MTSPSDQGTITSDPGTDAPAGHTGPPEISSGPIDQADEPTGREAARYRVQLRAAEGERDQLRTRVENMQRAEVTRLAIAANVAKPASIWGAIELSDLLDDDGELDPDKASAAIAAAIEDLGLATLHVLKPDHSQGPRGNAGTGMDWATALRPA